MHAPMTAELLTGCKQAQSLCCGLQMHQDVDKPGREPVLASFDLEGIADYIRSGEQFPQDSSSAVLLSVVDGHVTLLRLAAGKARRIVCMCGAGISVSAGGSTLQHATLRRVMKGLPGDSAPADACACPATIKMIITA